MPAVEASSNFVSVCNVARFGLESNRPEHFALGGRRIDEHPERLIGVDGEDHADRTVLAASIVSTITPSSLRRTCSTPCR